MDNGACVPRRVHTVVVSVQHSEKVTLDELRINVLEKVIKKVIPAKYLDDKTIFHVNPCGDFVIGGPQVIEKKIPPFISFCQDSEQNFKFKLSIIQ